jgi:hypothetical protein
MPIIFKLVGNPHGLKNWDKADPQKLGEALHKITDAKKGRLRKQDIVDAARSKKSPINIHFEWDNLIAGEAWRREQAGELLRVIVRIHDDQTNEPPRRAFYSIRDKFGFAYRAVDSILNSNDLQIALMESALQDLKAWENRYREIIDLCGATQEREELTRKIQDLIEAHRKGREAA